MIILGKASAVSVAQNGGRTEFQRPDDEVGEGFHRQGHLPAHGEVPDAGLPKPCQKDVSGFIM